MPSAEEIRSIVNSYIEMMCNSDVDNIIALFDEDATAEDPVGGAVQSGIDALRAFYASAAPLLQVELTGPVCVSGRACAFPILARLSAGDSVSYLDAVDVFTFDDAGKITSMRAFWNPEEMRPEK